ncbi:hypothetical protein AOLI_G00139500 [Acnodon oligacanthus]
MCGSRENSNHLMKQRWRVNRKGRKGTHRFPWQPPFTYATDMSTKEGVQLHSDDHSYEMNGKKRKDSGSLPGKFWSIVAPGVAMESGGRVKGSKFSHGKRLLPWRLHKKALACDPERAGLPPRRLDEHTLDMMKSSQAARPTTAPDSIPKTLFFNCEA